MTGRETDVVVIGCGPAGLAAAETVAKAGLSCVAIDRMGPGGQLMNLGELKGVPDLEAGATGPDLVASLADKAMMAGAELAFDDVERLTAAADGWLVEAVEQRLHAKAVVVASGLSPGTTGLDTESAYEGRGLSHCAHCDGPLFAGQPVVVGGSDAWTVEETMALAAHASHVTWVSDGQPSVPAGRLEALAALSNITALEGRITGLGGSDGLQYVEIEEAGAARRVEARGLFLYTYRRPAQAFLDGPLDEAAGLFLAGDVRGGATPTIVEAIADGQRAGQNAVLWLEAAAKA